MRHEERRNLKRKPKGHRLVGRCQRPKYDHGRQKRCGKLDVMHPAQAPQIHIRKGIGLEAASIVGEKGRTIKVTDIEHGIP